MEPSKHSWGLEKLLAAAFPQQLWGPVHRGIGLEAASREREAKLFTSFSVGGGWVSRNWDSARKHGEQLKRRQKQRRSREHETLNVIFQHVPVLLAVSVLLIWLALGLLQGSQGLPGLPGARGKQGPLVSTFSLTSPNLQWLRPCGWASTTTFLASCSSTG